MSAKGACELVAEGITFTYPTESSPDVDGADITLKSCDTFAHPQTRAPPPHTPAKHLKIAIDDAVFAFAQESLQLACVGCVAEPQRRLACLHAGDMCMGCSVATLAARARWRAC